MLRFFFVASTLMVAHASLATTDASPPPIPEPALSVPLPSVVVEVPEPRYVAPTLRDRIGRIWAPVFINGKGPFRLVLDTGANSSAILPSVAKSLAIPIQETRTVQLHGVTGSAIVPVISVDTMEIGDLQIVGANLPIVPDVFGGAEGILGAKGLGDKRIFIDFGHDTIRISTSHGAMSPPGFVRVPLKITRNELPLIEIRIGNVLTKAVIDTGAQQTIGNSALREALMRRARDGVDQSIVGITLDVAHGQSMATPVINLNGIEIHNMRVTFGDMFIFEKWKMTRDPAMILGMDVIGSLDTVILDYKMRELQLRTRR